LIGLDDFCFMAKLPGQTPRIGWLHGNFQAFRIGEFRQLLNRLLKVPAGHHLPNSQVKSFWTMADRASAEFSCTKTSD
jgi:hypothetical protein